jgi:two-component system, chemotaxis family, chemotaxis protein CheY
MEAIRVLVVDDLEFMRQAITDILESSGITVAGQAPNGAEGIEAYLHIHPDVVLMDITMPVMNGLQALKGIRRRDPQARVVMCSALGQQRYIIRAIQLGARDFIVKPFRQERIVNAVRKAAPARG